MNAIKILGIISLIIIASCTSKKDWGKVEISKDVNDDYVVVLENEKMIVTYGTEYGTESGRDEGETILKELILKSNPDVNVAGSFLDASAHRGMLINAVIVKDSEDEKTIYMEWTSGGKHKNEFPGPAKTEITIYPDSTVIKYKYIDFCFAHIVDIGLDSAHMLENDWGGQYMIHGYERDSFPLYTDCFYWKEYGDYECDSAHIAEGYGVQGDPGALDYNGYYVMGVYGIENNLGFGRVVPTENLRVIKLLWNKGFELFPEGKGFTSYMYIFDNGAQDALSVGREIVDKIKN